MPHHLSSYHRRLGELIALLLLLLGVAACQTDEVIPRPPSPTPSVVGEPAAGSSLRGAFVAWGVNANAVPPARSPQDPLAPGNHVLGIDCLSYLGSGGDVGARGVWDNRKAIDWGPIDRCIEGAAGQTVKLPDGSTVPQPVILTVPSVYADTGSRYYRTVDKGEAGSEGNPFIRLHLPPWMQNDSYLFTFRVPGSNNYYQSIRYDGEFKQRAIEFVQAAGKRYNANPQVVAVRVAVGMQGESHPVVPCVSYWDTKPPAGGDQPACGEDSRESVLAAHEGAVSCEGYVSFVQELSEAAHAAFGDKAVVSMVDASPCTTLSGKSLRRNLYSGPWATKAIGISMNNLNIDRPDADEARGNIQAPWNKWTVGLTMNSMGYPMLFEYDSHTPGDVAMYWTTLSGAGNGGHFLLHHSPWNGSYSPLMWEVVDYWLASDQRAWIVFRDREYPTYDFADGFGTSGTIGDWAKHLQLANPEDAPQACERGLLAAAKRENDAAVAAGRLNVQPACPGPALPAPSASSQGPVGTADYNRMFNRQARRLDGMELRIAVADAWPYSGRAYQVDVTVSYLDTGKDSFDVVLPASSGAPVRHTITKTGDGSWKRATWSTPARIGNLLDGAFIRIVDDGGGAEYLHEIFVSIADEEPLPDPTATPAPTSPPTATPTASPTIAPSPTVAPSATATLAPTVPPTATSVPSPTSVPATSPMPSVVPTSPAATATPVPVTSATPASPSATPVATATSTPSATPIAAVTGEPPNLACLPRIESNVALAGSPKTLAAGSNGFYAGLFEENKVTFVGPEGNATLWSAPTGDGGTNGIAMVGDIVITSNRGAGTVTLHDAANGERLAVLRVGSLPWGVSGAGGLAYVANFGSGTVSVIDPAQKKVIATTFVGPSPVAVVTDGNRVYVAHLDGMVAELDRQGRTLKRAKSPASDVRGAAWDPATNRLYLASRAGYVVVLDAATLAEEKRIRFAGPVYAIALNPDTGRLFAVDAANDRLYYVGQDEGEPGMLPLPAQGGEQGGQGLAIRDNRIAVANLGARSITFVVDEACAQQATPQATQAVATAVPSPARTSQPTPTRTPSPTATRTPQPAATVAPGALATPSVVRPKIQIVWPHGGASVREANRANITAYLFAGDGSDPRTAFDPPPCSWSPTVRLWAALNAQPARQVAVGQKRTVRGGGRVFPAWDFNDIDVSAARDPANRLYFYVTVDGVGNLRNVWAHAADARTLFPQTDVPQSALRTRPSAVDARIEIVWPHGGAPVQEASRANVTAYLFHAGTQSAIAPQTPWTPAVRLHWSLNNDAEAPPGRGVLGLPRRITAPNGVTFLGWDFNDIDVSAVQEPLNKIYFWVTVDGVTSYPSIWAHGVDARTLFPQPDVPNSCR